MCAVGNDQPGVLRAASREEDLKAAILTTGGEGGRDPVSLVMGRKPPLHRPGSLTSIIPFIAFGIMGCPNTAPEASRDKASGEAGNPCTNV